MMNWYKFHLKSSSLYTNTILTAIIVLVGLCVVQASYSTASFWKDIKKEKKGTIVFTYVDTPGYSYLDEDGQIKGLGVAIFNDFVTFIEEKEQVKLSLRINELKDAEEMARQMRISSGGVFGWSAINTAGQSKMEASPVFFKHPGKEAPTEMGFIMPKNSDWAPLMTSFYHADGGYLNSASYKENTATYTFKATPKEEDVAEKIIFQ